MRNSQALAIISGLISVVALAACDPYILPIEEGPAESGSSAKRNAVGAIVPESRPAKIQTVGGVDCTVVPRSTEEIELFRKNCV